MMNMGNVYIILFDNRTAKVGLTRDVGSRISQQLVSARSLSLGVDRIFISCQSGSFKRQEADMINYMSGRFESTTPEYFVDVNIIDLERMMARLKIPYILAVDVKRKVIGGKVAATITMVGHDFDIQKGEKDYGLSAKIMGQLEASGAKSEGVICNKNRKYDRKVVTDTLKNMAENGILVAEENTHPKNSSQIITYSLAP